MKLVGVNILLTYTDDLVISKTSVNEIKNIAEILVKISQNMGLIANEVKTKYMIVSKQITPKKPQDKLTLIRTITMI